MIWSNRIPQPHHPTQNAGQGQCKSHLGDYRSRVARMPHVPIRTVVHRNRFTVLLTEVSGEVGIRPRLPNRDRCIQSQAQALKQGLLEFGDQLPVPVVEKHSQVGQHEKNDHTWRRLVRFQRPPLPHHWLRIKHHSDWKPENVLNPRTSAR